MNNPEQIREMAILHGLKVIRTRKNGKTRFKLLDTNGKTIAVETVVAEHDAWINREKLILSHSRNASTNIKTRKVDVKRKASGKLIQRCADLTRDAIPQNESTMKNHVIRRKPHVAVVTTKKRLK
jgi:hypothetical protein